MLTREQGPHLATTAALCFDEGWRGGVAVTWLHVKGSQVGKGLLQGTQAAQSGTSVAYVAHVPIPRSCMGQRAVLPLSAYR